MSVQDNSLLGIIKGCKKITVKDLRALFNFDPSQFEEKIDTYIDRSYISRQGEELTFNKNEEEIPEIKLSESIVLGYIKLRRLSNLEDIAKEFNLGYVETLKTIGTLNLMESIDLRIHYENTSDEVIVYVEVEEIGFNLEILHSKPNSEGKLFDLISKNYMESSRSFHTFHILVGFLKLQREPNWGSKQFEYLVQNSHHLLSRIYETRHILDMICLLALDKALKIELKDGAFIELAIQQKLSYNNQDLLVFDQSIMNDIVSELGIKRMVNFSDFIQQLNDDQQIIPILSILAYFGKFEGSLGADDTIVIHKIDTSIINFDVLSKDEKIILGYLKSSNKPNLSVLSKLLGLDKDIIRHKLNGFQFFTETKAQIARNNDVLLDRSFSIPLITSPDDIPKNSQIILGRLFWDGEIKLKDLSNKFNQPRADIERVVYEFIGSGLIQVEVDRDKITLKDISSYHSNVDEEFFKIIFDELDTTTLTVDFSVINCKLQIPQSDFESLKYRFIFNYYHQIVEKSNEWIKMKYIPNRFRRFKCLHCHSEISRMDSACGSCNKPIEFCTVCRAILIQNDQLLSCPNCGGMSHTDHILVWLKIKNFCPVCKSNIGDKQLMEVKI